MTGGSWVHRRVGIDNYGLTPLDLPPLETLEWARAHGAAGVAFSGIADHHRERLTDAALEDVRAYASGHGLYLEWGGGQHIPRDMTTWGRKDLEAINLRAAREAVRVGARIIRSCSGGLMRWDATSPPTEELLRDAAGALRAMLPMLRDHGVALAIETHFEFTSFELLRMFEMCEIEPGDALGICLDTMNLLTMLEHPVWATTRLLPWVVSTHIKDGGILLSAEGLTTFPVPLGTGVIDLARINAILPAGVDLSVESHGGSFLLPIHDPVFLAKFPDLTGAEIESLIALSEATSGLSACRPLPRERWPSVCETRMASDLEALKALRDASADGSPRERAARFHYKTAAALVDEAQSLGLDLPFADRIDVLLTPASIGGRPVVNRLVAQPMEGCDGLVSGAPGELTVRRYLRFGAGGYGVIWIEATSVLPDARAKPRQLWITRDTMPAIRALVGETRAAARARFGDDGIPYLILQLTHSGRFSRTAPPRARKVACHNPHLDREPLPVWSDDDLERVRDAFVDAARLAAEAGFDAVDIKACHGYLVNELLGARRRENSRYGGSFENRSRLLVETVQAVRAAVPRLSVAVRFNATDGVAFPYGFGVEARDGSVEIDLDEPRQLVRCLAAAGCAIMNVSAGIPTFNPHVGRPYDRPVAGTAPSPEHPMAGVVRLLGLARETQAAAGHVPVVATGLSWLRQFWPYVAAAVVERRQATLVGLGREAFAYPDAPADLMARGSLDQTKCCIACSKCTELMRLGSTPGCATRDRPLYSSIHRDAVAIAGSTS